MVDSMSMLPIEQIFLRVPLQDGHWGVQVTAATGAVPYVDLEEITEWFTGTEKELTIRCDPFNLFFHLLPSGHYALGIIYPARQSQTLIVRVLLISPKCLLECGNHPITLFESLRAQLPFVEEPPQHFSPLTPTIPSLQINVSLLEKLQKHLGAMALAQLTQSLFHAECTLFTSRSVSALSVLTALFDLTPIPYRPELTFSSDFFVSSNNSFRLTGFSKLQQRTIRLMKQWGVPVISLEHTNKGSVETLDPWARFVYQLLQTRNVAFLEQQQNIEYQLAVPESQPIIWDNLNEVGVSWSKAMFPGTLPPGTLLPGTLLPEKHISPTEFSTHSLEELRCVATVDQMILMLSGAKQSAVKPMSDQRLGDRFPQFQEELSELEAYLVRGMFGDESALPKMKQAWLRLLPQLDSEAKEEIQEAIVATLHSTLITLEGNTEQRLLRSSQLLELTMFFLHPGGNGFA